LRQAYDYWQNQPDCYFKTREISVLRLNTPLFQTGASWANQQPFDRKGVCFVIEIDNYE